MHDSLSTTAHILFLWLVVAVSNLCPEAFWSGPVDHIPCKSRMNLEGPD